MKRLLGQRILILGGVMLTIFMVSGAFADGTETLGPPSIDIAQGTDILIAGTGLRTAGTSDITVEIPLGATVDQVLLYWEGTMSTNVAGDSTAIVNGTEVIGTLIGGPTIFWSTAYSSAYRADITGLGEVGPGSNTLSISGIDYSRAVNGAGVFVIINDGSGLTDIQIRDGVDLAFFDFPSPRDTTVAQTFIFDPSAFDRTAALSLMVSSVEGIFNPDDGRPTVIEITVNGSLETYNNILENLDGEDWDSKTIYPLIPAGATDMTVQIFSRDDAGTGKLPASLSWLGAGLSVPLPDIGCRVTGGGNDTSGAALDGTWDGTFANGRFRNGNGRENRYTFGGQAGANTALPPQPKGEWTHHQQSGPAGSFVFHGGTASAPPGTEIDVIVCSDPGGCSPSGDPPSPAKQIDFAGIGTFKNIKEQNSNPALAGVLVGTSLHYFDVHIEDLGEPGNKIKIQELKQLSCPDPGSGTDAFADPPIFNDADCGCGDFYRIRIYAGATKTGSPIYEVYGYINGGNFQIHHLTGFDR